jgi:hypothetical protein
MSIDYTNKSLTYWTTPIRNDRTTPILLAALAIKLDQVPHEALNAQSLTVRDDMGFTPLHFAAQRGQLNVVPALILTEKYMTIANADLQTPLHFAASRGYLNQIPTAVLTAKNLLFKSHDGSTPLHWAAFRHLDQIPPHIITTKKMMIEDHYGRTPIGHSLSRYESQESHLALLNKCIKEYPTKCVQAVFGKNPSRQWQILHSFFKEHIVNTLKPASIPIWSKIPESHKRLINSLSYNIKDWENTELTNWIYKEKWSYEGVYRSPHV